jgi:hypothetical protein
MKMDAFQNTASILSDFLPGKFGKFWIQRTIQLKPTFDPEFSSGGMGGRGGYLPIIANATFIDSTLIECGMKEFENLAEMVEEEIVEYGKIYRQKYKTGDYYFIWLELQTHYTKEILDLDRLSIYWEVDNGDKFEPAEVIEYPLENSLSLINNFNPVKNDSLNNEYQPWKISSKTILLFFSKANIYGEEVIDINTKSVSLVLFDWNNKSVKNKGTWYLKYLN